MTYRTPEDLAAQQWPLERFVRGMIRRMAVTFSDKVKWQLLGNRGGSGGDEVASFDVFSGIGFFSRPPRSGKPEAIVASYGSTRTSAIIATRDEATRQVGAGDLQEGETCVYNDKARIIVKADGSVEIRLHGGVALSLALKSDYDGLADWIHSTMVIATPSGNSSPGTVNVPPEATGTTVLLAQ